MRILIDGMDLSGKTTLARRLTRRLEARGLRVHHTRLTLHPGLHADLARLAYRRLPPGSLWCAWAFVWAALVDRLLDGWRGTGSWDVHLHEAHAAHTVAYAEGFGHGRTAALLAALSPLWPAFDHTLLLTASLTTRRERLEQRPVNDANDLLLVREPERFRRIDARLVCGLMGRGATVLQTDARGLAEVERAAWSALGQALQSSRPPSLAVAGSSSAGR